MKNIHIQQTVDFTSGQRGGEIAPDGANGACSHCSGDLNFAPFDTEYGEAGLLLCSHGDGQNYAWSAPVSTDRHGLV
jgi:hypothetical protein